MLSELYIENLAVIAKASINFGNNLNVFTGETGAGKSILINGINAVLGQRVTKDIVRTGEAKAVISAVFTMLSTETLSKLGELGISAENGELIISREIMSDGGSVARVNSRPVNVSVIREIGETLVNIHGQHDNQILLSSDRHLEILDSFAESQGILDEYKTLFKELQSTARELNKLISDSARKEQRIAQLNEIISDIEPLNIRENEDDEVEAEFTNAENSIALTQAVYKATELLYGGDEMRGADSLTKEANTLISLHTESFSDIEPICERINSVQIELEDIANELNRLLNSLEVNPQHFAMLSQRRDELIKIKRKYGPQLSDVLIMLENSQNELNRLESSSESIEELTNKKNSLLKEVSLKAAELSEFRKAAAVRFSEQVAAELEFLNMPDVKLVVSHKNGKLTSSGMDDIEFLISANVGEEPKPIAKIASGGELSRIMLALKNVIAERDNIPTLIFDEIDTGVSGRAAQKIGIKLHSIAKHRQVLCVTHLSQIAVEADNHIMIEKKVIGERTETIIHTLDFDERKAEIARILGGNSVTELLLKNAEELLKEAKTH